MRNQNQNQIVQRSTSTTRLISNRITPSSNHHTTLFQSSDNNILLRCESPSVSSSNNQLTKPTTRPTTIITNSNNNNNSKFSILVRSLINMFTFPATMIPLPACKWLTIPSHLSIITTSHGSKVTGTLFGHRRGYISFAVQLDPAAEPILLLELAISTASLVKEMSSGLVRIALECDKALSAGDGGRRRRNRKLLEEPAWTMQCNGRNCGYAVRRTCGEREWHVLRTVRRVSVGAGVIPVVEEGGDGEGRKVGGSEEGELMYMRARFERVVGSRDSEAFYMLNPDGNGGPELSIFLLRL